MDNFYDSPIPRQIPTIGHRFNYCKTLDFPRSSIIRGTMMPEFVESNIEDKIMEVVFGFLVNILPGWFSTELPKALKDKLNREALAYAKNLYHDYGCF